VSLEHEMTYKFPVRRPTVSTAGSPLGELVYWEMTAGERVGARIKVRIVMPGGDWNPVGSDDLHRR
jgi:hypothetical protein